MNCSPWNKAMIEVIGDSMVSLGPYFWLTGENADRESMNGSSAAVPMIGFGPNPGPRRNAQRVFCPASRQRGQFPQRTNLARLCAFYGHSQTCAISEN
jgi:hypothetical protein